MGYANTMHIHFSRGEPIKKKIEANCHVGAGGIFKYEN
jgi:hypothetical protein